MIEVKDVEKVMKREAEVLTEAVKSAALKYAREETEDNKIAFKEADAILTYSEQIKNILLDAL